MIGAGGVIRPDGEREDGANRVRESWSVGQLLTIKPERRAELIARMPIEQRAALAELANFGLGRAMQDADRCRSLMGQLLARDRDQGAS